MSNERLRTMRFEGKFGPRHCSPVTGPPHGRPPPAMTVPTPRDRPPRVAGKETLNRGSVSPRGNGKQHLSSIARQLFLIRPSQPYEQNVPSSSSGWEAAFNVERFPAPASENHSAILRSLP